jgi:hypothetical protein
MSLRGSISLIYGDGEHVFRLGIGQSIELQAKFREWRGPDFGPGSMVRAAVLGNLFEHEAHEILRLGLIGGGMLPSQAHVLLARNFEAEGMSRNTSVVLLILGAMFPDAEEDKKKDDDGGEASPTGRSTPPESTPPDTSWDSARARSTNGHGPNSI